MTMVGNEVSEPNPLAELKPVRLQAPQGGSDNGQLVVSGDAPLVGLSAGCGDLTGPGDAKIPIQAVRIRYAQPQSGTLYPNPFDVLLDHPCADTKLQPVWLTVDTPADAKPGLYAGTLALSGPTTIKVPVELTVYGWTLPDARQWKTWAFFFQSPETLAAHYKVPLWSDAHFKLIERSLALQGKLGQKVAIVHGIAGGLLGKESMVLYRREGDKVTPDFIAVERYLKLYRQHVGDPEVVCLYLWDTNVEGWLNYNGDPESRAPAATAIPVTFRVGDVLEPGTLPRFGDPATASVWLDVVAGMKREMKGLNWPERALMFGLMQDQVTGPEATGFFVKHFPDVKWVIYTHFSTPPKPLKLGIMMNPDTGGDYNRGWTTPRGYPNLTNQRFSLVCGRNNYCFSPFGSPVANYRISPFITLFHGYNGPGGHGFDYWPLPGKNIRFVESRFHGGPTSTNWGHVIRGAIHNLLAPGPDGPAATVRYELLREGFQEAQALIYLETNVGNPKMPADLVARSKAVRLRLRSQIPALDDRSDVGWAAEIDALYRTAADVQAALGTLP
jgi:hypothetical protein